MSTLAEEQAVRILPPRDTTIQIAQCSGTATLVSIIGSGNRYVTFMADGGDVYIVFSAVNTVVANATDYTGAGKCWKIPANTVLDPYPVALIDNYFSCVTASGTAILRYFVSANSPVA